MSKQPFYEKLGFTKQSLSLLIVAGLLIFIALILQAVRLAQDVSSPSQKKREHTLRSDIVEDNIIVELAEDARQQNNIRRQLDAMNHFDPEDLKPVEVKFFSHNPVMGSHRAPVELVIFTDSGCAACRSHMSSILDTVKLYGNKVRVVFKYVSLVNDGDTGAIFDQLAYRAGAFEEYYKNLLKADLSSFRDEEYMELLDKSGVSYNKQRQLMRDEVKYIVRDLQKDINQADALNVNQRVKEPTLYLNGYDLRKLGYPTRLEPYLGRVVAGKNIHGRIE